MLDKRVSIKFRKKDGQQMAAVLAKETGKTIDFVPYPQTAGKLYNFELKNSDIWPALVFLDKRGTVKINQIEFRTFRNIQIEMKSGRKFSVRFRGISARDAVSKLAFMSRLNLEIKSGDPASPVSVELNEMSLRDILKEISNTAKVEIDVNKTPQNK